MAGQYEKAITIKQVIDSINIRHCLLPAIQREFFQPYGSRELPIYPEPVQ